MPLRSSPKVKELAGALCALQAEALPFPQGFADWWAAAHRLGLSVVQGCSPAGDGMLICTRILHTSGEWIEDEFPVGKPPKEKAARMETFHAYRRLGLQLMLGSPLDVAASQVKQGATPKEP